MVAQSLANFDEQFREQHKELQILTEAVDTARATVTHLQEKKDEITAAIEYLTIESMADTILTDPAATELDLRRAAALTTSAQDKRRRAPRTCPLCGCPLRFRPGRRDEGFFGCSSYPACLHTEPV
jgi:DNA repair exonuclease SbcCD ATPase subunit